MNVRIVILVGFVLFLSAAAHAFAGGCEDWAVGPLVENGYALNGVNDVVLATTSWDPDGGGPLAPELVIAGRFTNVEGITVSDIAVRDNATGVWQRMGADFDDYIEAVIVYNGQLVVGGRFTHIGASSIAYVARWDGSTWQPMGNGLDNYVNAFAVYNGELIAGGFFFLPGSNNNSVARWNGSIWQGVGNGPTYPTYALAVYQGSLYAGGTFTHTGEVLNVHNLARWDGSHWHSVAGGLLGAGTDGGGVESLLVYNNQLIVGGFFVTAGGVPASNIASWNGASWNPLAAGLTDGLEFSAVLALAIYNNNLVAGGYFLSAGGQPANHVARWDNVAWHPMGGGFGEDQSYITVETLFLFNSELVAGGIFVSADSQSANALAHWNGSQWQPYGGVGMNSINAITTFGSRLAVGGDFIQTSTGSPPHHILSWNGVDFAPFGSGMNAQVNALTSYTNPGLTGDLELVAGGFFTTAGGIPANYVARWTEDPILVFPPPTWHAMGTGFNGGVNALTRFNGRYIAGGYFTTSGNGATSLSRIAAWNETNSTWDPLTTGMNGSVSALRGYILNVSLARLVVAGYFTTAGGVSAPYVAGWTEHIDTIGTPVWTAMGSGFNNAALALEYYSGSIYAGGAFTLSGATPVNRIARFNGSAWVQVGNGIGFNGSVTALKTMNGMLYAGGDFTNVDGIAANHVARWNGSIWQDVEGGADSTVLALALFHDEVHVGGVFNNVHSSTLATKRWARYLLTGAPWIPHQPISLYRPCKSDAVFALTMPFGYDNLSYEWHKDGVPIDAGPTGMGSRITIDGPTLTVEHASDFDEGTYDCTISNNCGSVMCAGIPLEVADTCPPCPADMVDSATFAWPPDGIVDGADLAYLLGAWGRHPGPPYSGADIVDHRTFQWPPDGLVDGADLAVLLGAWGVCP